MNRQSFSHLPRETRDTLFMLVVIAWVVLPQLGALPLWCSLLSAAVMTWRAVLAWRAQALPSRWWLAGVLALGVFGTLITFKTILGREAGVTLLVLLLALKTLELRARRDAFVVFFLSFFLMLTNFFHSQSLLTAAAMLIALLGLLTALVNAHMPVGRPPLLQAARTATGMALLGAPVMVLLFVLFPRVAPFWGLPSDGMSGRSGLSDQMTVGTIANLALDESVAMRIRFETAVPEQYAMYFRGPVLSAFDGRTWQVLEATMQRPSSLPVNLKIQGPAIKYQVTLEPSKQSWLMVLDATPTAPALYGKTARMTPELQWVLDSPVTDLLRYQATSYPDFSYGPLELAPGLQDFLALPAGFNPRTLQLAAELTGDVSYTNYSNTDWTNLVLERLRSGGYSYTLEPGTFGLHSADEFWFDRKAGFCEHIAASFVILMRALKVPARVVTGYQGGDQNPMDGFWTVRQSDAHAWAEVWQANQGWVRIDPTSVVAPGRTGSFQRLSKPRGIIATAILGNVNPELASGLRAVWEAVNNRWNQQVLNYTQAKQLDLLKNLGFSEPDWQDLVFLLCGIVLAGSLTGAAWSAWERHRQDPWLRLLGQAVRRLHPLGIILANNTTPRQICQQLPDSTAQLNLQPWQDWLIKLETLRYAPRSDDEQTASFKQQLATLERELKHLPLSP